MRMKLMLLSPLSNLFLVICTLSSPPSAMPTKLLLCLEYVKKPPPTDINPEAKSNSNQEVCYVDKASPTAKVGPPGTTWSRLMKF
ncbi:hypothetical protein MKX03_021998 [Papaver bracteatum]|nr:hypothetical protein MKX03_021998 [Papaver bracteatum]